MCIKQIWQIDEFSTSFSRKITEVTCCKVVKKYELFSVAEITLMNKVMCNFEINSELKCFAGAEERNDICRHYLDTLFYLSGDHDCAEPSVFSVWQLSVLIFWLWSDSKYKCCSNWQAGCREQHCEVWDSNCQPAAAVSHWKR